MNEACDPNDRQRHRNLQRIGQLLDLPERADASRRARWQEGMPADRVDPTAKGVTFMQRHRAFAWVTSGALAAALLLAAYLAVGPFPRVSAATIFQDFAKALSQSLAINIEDVDFGNVKIDGEILINRSQSPAGETRYAEVHALMRADNPEWNDLDAVIVICETPDRAWQYCRGNGGAGGIREKEVIPTAYYLPEQGWRKFAEEPLDSFGSMPLALGYGDGDSNVSYRFTREQRTVTEAVLRFLLELGCGNRTTSELAADLEAAATEVNIERGADRTFVLTASGFTRLGDFVLDPPEVPDVAHLIRQFRWELQYNPTTGGVIGWSTNPPPGLYGTGVGLVTDAKALGLPLADPEKLVAHLKERAERVEIQRESETRWVLDVTGYPFPTSTTGLDWLGEYVLQLRESLVLEVVYDAGAGSVESAEFRGFTGLDSRVRLNIGEGEIEPSRLEPDGWLGTGLTQPKSE